MASPNGRPRSSTLTPNPSPSPFSSPPQSRARLKRPSNSRRTSTLRSAAEQLRDIKQGDTSWQRNREALLNEQLFSEAYPSPSPTHLTDPWGSSPNERSSHETVHERDATETRVRVYVHIVRKTDTMPLILLAYGISATALKKANRLWANDSIQIRNELYLPVDQCDVHPQPCSRPDTPQVSSNSTHAANGTVHQDTTIHEDENGEWPPLLEITPDYPGERGGPESAEKEEAEEWVMIPEIGPVRIISLQADKLSYFPGHKRTRMERASSLPGLDSLVAEERPPRDSMDSVVSVSSIGSLVEEGVGRMVRFWHDNHGRRQWAKIAKDLIEL